MSQHDYVLDNAVGAAFRTDLNAALAAIVSQNSGATEPTTMYAYQFWADTTAGVLKIRNAANDAWITLMTLAGVFVTPALGTPASGALDNCTSNTEAANNNSTQLATTAYADRLTAGTLAGAFTTLSGTSTNAKSLTGIWHVNIRDTTSYAAGVGGGISLAGYKSSTQSLGIFGAIAGYKANGTDGNELGGTKIYANDSIALVQVGEFSSTGLAVTGSISATTTIKAGGYTVATLPAGVTGDECYVTDATAPTWNAALTGGGAVVVGARKNATIWVAF